MGVNCWTAGSVRLVRIELYFKYFYPILGTNRSYSCCGLICYLFSMVYTRGKSPDFWSDKKIKKVKLDYEEKTQAVVFKVFNKSDPAK